MGWLSRLRSKANPVQHIIREEEGTSKYTSAPILTHQEAYSTLEVVNRGVNIIVDLCSAIKVDIGDSIGSAVTTENIRKKRLDRLLNFSPNLYQTADVFKRNILMDLLLEGNAFIYFDGAHLFNLPASIVEIVIDKHTFVNSYKYNDVVFRSDEIIHVMENSSVSIFRGQSRLLAASDAINAITTLTKYHTDFFKNGAIPGIVLKTPNNLSPRNKQKVLRDWSANYSVQKGGRRPMILDGDFDIANIGVENPRELDFQKSIESYEGRVLAALGVPPIMLSSGNNANISPNIKMLYTSTIIPLSERVVAAFERFFGYDIKPVFQDVIALRPDLTEQGNYYTSLVNSGILTRNEVRTLLRMQSSPSAIADELILPANIAGSAANANLGGRPTNSTNQ